MKTISVTRATSGLSFALKAIAGLGGHSMAYRPSSDASQTLKMVNWRRFAALCLIAGQLLTLSPNAFAEERSVGRPSVNGLDKKGGVDGSGGDIIGSSDKAVFQEINDLKKNLAIAMERLNTGGFVSEALADSKYRSRESQPDLSPLSRLWELAEKNANGSSAISSLMKAIDTMVIKPSSVDCIDKNGKVRVAVAYGDGRICLGIDRAKLLPIEALRAQLLAVGAHELVHVLGEPDESVATDVQKFFINYAAAVDQKQDLQCKAWVTTGLPSRDEPTYRVLVEKDFVIQGNWYTKVKDDVLVFQNYRLRYDSFVGHEVRFVVADIPVGWFPHMPEAYVAWRGFYQEMPLTYSAYDKEMVGYRLSISCRKQGSQK